jgi:hypothetical protein
MKLRLLPALILLFGITSCTQAQNRALPLDLATFTENYVTVSIHLNETPDGEYILSATFTPPEGHHLYGKDIPLTGVDGLGRPTLLELPAESHMKAVGELMESVKEETPDFEPKNLLVYPIGEVTLSMPVELPPGAGWVDDAVKISFMACSDVGCKAPVVGKIVPVRIPGADAVK